MRAFLFLLCLAAPALADAPVINPCATGPEACLVEATLPALELLDASPVPTGPDRLTYLAYSATGPVAVELSTTDGSLLRQVPLRLKAEFDLHTGLVAAGGKGYALSLWQGGTELGLQFFAPDGAPLGLLPATWPDGWPLEMSLANAMTLLASQGLLAFDGTTLKGTIYRFDLSISAADGMLSVTETRPGTGPTDTLGAHLARWFERQVDPVGAEAVHVEGRLAAVTTWAADGSPSRLILRAEEGGEIYFDQRLGPGAMAVEYAAARVSADGTRIAAVRTTEGSAPEARLMVFDTASTAPVLEAPLPQGRRPFVVWLPDGRIAVLQDDGEEGTRLLVFRAP